MISRKGAVAQLGERLPCTQEVRSSILLGSTTVALHLDKLSVVLKDVVDVKAEVIGVMSAVLWNGVDWAGS